MRAYLFSLLGLVAFASTAPAQTVRPKARLALFGVAFYGKGANSLEPRDSLVAVMTDSILRADLERSGNFQILDSAGLAQAVAGAETGGVDCVTLECRRQVSKKAGADWMVTSKLSKTSNLIWYLSGQLTDVASGRRLLDDEFELKGIAEDIAKGGAHSLARRIVKAANAASEVDTPTTRMSPAELKAKLAAATEDTAPDLRKANLSGLGPEWGGLQTRQSCRCPAGRNQADGSEPLYRRSDRCGVDRRRPVQGQHGRKRASAGQASARQPRGRQPLCNHHRIGRPEQRQPGGDPYHRLPPRRQLERSQSSAGECRRRPREPIDGRHAGHVRRGRSERSRPVRCQPVQGATCHTRT